VLSTLINSTEQPALKWNTPICTILRDDFVLPDPYITTHATIEDALSHRTGMPRHDAAYGGLYNGEYMTNKSLVRSMRDLSLTAELRTKWQYCNMMYIVISHLIETLTSRPLKEVMKTRILEPLGMNSTFFSPNEARESGHQLATGYAYQEPKKSYKVVPDSDASTQGAGAGFIVSNVLDYVPWLKCLINKSSPLTEEQHEAIRTPRMLTGGGWGENDLPFTGPVAYSLGWLTGTYKGHEWFHHTGGVEAYTAYVTFFPSLKYGLVAFGNTSGTAGFVLEKAIWHLIDERLRTPEADRFDWDKRCVCGYLTNLPPRVGAGSLQNTLTR
jgi:CubicO group peptidase (beta-lactamase class C family)